MVVHSLVCGLLLYKIRLPVVELRGFVGIKNSWDVPLRKGTTDQSLCVAYDIWSGLVLTKKRRRCFLILLLLLVHRSALIINCKLPTLTSLWHWLCCLLEKEKHIPFVFWTNNNVEMQGNKNLQLTKGTALSLSHQSLEISIVSATFSSYWVFMRWSFACFITRWTYSC